MLSVLFEWIWEKFKIKWKYFIDVWDNGDIVYNLNWCFFFWYGVCFFFYLIIGDCYVIIVRGLDYFGFLYWFFVIFWGFLFKKFYIFK